MSIPYFKLFSRKIIFLLIFIFIMKLLFSVSTINQIQWFLAPIATLVTFFDGTAFEWIPDVGYAAISGIVIENTETRSQLGNREKAMQLLKSQLYEIEMQKKLEARNEIEGEKKKIEWGSQIRSYVLDDRRVKDHRTNYQESNPDSVLDGNLDGFLKAYLMEN